MNKIKATKVSNMDELDLEAGNYLFDEGKKNIIFSCPCGCHTLHAVPTDKWNWNKNEDKPTLNPSIQVMRGCKWHGFLTDGEWITV